MTCHETFNLSSKQAYRIGLAKRKALSSMEEGDMLKRPVPGQLYGPPTVKLDDQQFPKEFPTLFEYLTQNAWPDGSVRTTSTLLIFMDGASLKMVLNDRDNNRSAFFSASTFMGTLEVIEDALRDESVDWKSKGTGSQAGKQIPY